MFVFSRSKPKKKSLDVNRVTFFVALLVFNIHYETFCFAGWIFLLVSTLNL